MLMGVVQIYASFYASDNVNTINLDHRLVGLGAALLTVRGVWNIVRRSNFRRLRTEDAYYN